MTSTHLQVVTTVASQEDAARIAAELVRRRLAACVQVSGPLSSTYRWQGQVETAREWCCTIKTTSARYAALEQALRELHPYELPEILALPVVAGSPAYLAWLTQETADE
jgi:periplasmic divalent cation tolerance protein